VSALSPASPRAGTKPLLVQRCVDGELNGALPRCPLCEKGRLKRPDGPNAHKLFVCGGHFDDESKAYRTCAFTAEPSKVDRLPWRTPDEGRRPTTQDPAAKKGKQALAELDVEVFAELEMIEQANKLVELAREAGATLSDDPNTARIAAGTALTATKDDDSNSDPRAALASLLKKFPPKRTVPMQSIKHPDNATICALLKEYGDLLEKLGESPFAVNGARKALSAIMQLDYKITNGKSLGSGKATKVRCRCRYRTH
jgi:hypothetical protein